MVLGLAFLCASVYAESQTSGDGWSAIVARNVAGVGIAASLLTMVASLVGCWAATTGRRNVLVCYMCFFAFIFSLQVAAAVTMSNYSTQLKVTDASVTSGSLTNPTDINIMNAVYSVYTKCCSGCPVNVCNNPVSGSFVNGTAPNCVNAVCTFVTTACVGPSSDMCFNFPAGTPQVIPPYAIDDQVCKAMAYLTYNTVPLVGKVSTGACGAGDPKLFWQALNTYVSNAVGGVAIFYIIVAFFESLVLPAGIYVCAFFFRVGARAACICGKLTSTSVQCAAPRGASSL